MRIRFTTKMPERFRLERFRLGRLQLGIGKDLRLKTNQDGAPLLFGVGVFMGILCMNIWKEKILLDTGLFGEEMLQKLRESEIDRDSFFFYLFRKRLGPLLIGGALATTYLRKFIFFGGLLLTGGAVGLYWAALVIRYGLKGMALAVVAVFPQIFLYIPALCLFVRWCRHKRWWQPVAAVALICVGCLLETYVNLNLLKSFLEYF